MGQLERLLPGVYGKVGAGETLDGKLQAVRAYGDDLVVTRHHAAALTWWPEVECPSSARPGRHEIQAPAASTTRVAAARSAPCAAGA